MRRTTLVAAAAAFLALAAPARAGDVTVTYDKGGWVFWMLLNRMGRDAALAGIQEFIAHYSTDRDHPVLAEVHPLPANERAGDWYAIVAGGYKLVQGDGRARELFHLVEDPDETRNLLDREEERAADDGGQRWDGVSVHDFEGTYGDYVLSKVSKVFPELRRDVLAPDL